MASPRTGIHPPGPSKFLELPAELRNSVYELVVAELEDVHLNSKGVPLRHALMQTSVQLRNEFGPMWTESAVKKAKRIVVHVVDFDIADIDNIDDTISKQIVSHNAELNGADIGDYEVYDKYGDLKYTISRQGIKQRTPVLVRVSLTPGTLHRDSTLEQFCLDISGTWFFIRSRLTIAVHPISNADLDKASARVGIRGRKPPGHPRYVCPSLHMDYSRMRQKLYDACRL
ncbi:uncharacterized protein LTR77_004797 [Saxophila tyrrhenica]|uniref:Uncharacterized protein n=1 Tax=Saxophila tyrrhenica TaxID=1690608 RepID=A0AAV9PA90_9PEZI|nr:hypothetical protein LTR77_004797 [Saxophila tyrrhenica]